MSVLISFGHVLFEAGTTIHDQSPWLNQIARKYVDKLFWGQYLMASRQTM